MVHPNGERYCQVVGRELEPDPARRPVAEDVFWFEAGNPTPYIGRNAVVARLSGLPGDAPPAIEFDALLADDDHLAVVGRAHFEKDEQSLDYRFVEHLTFTDGKVTERRSFMDAVPDDSAAFFTT